MNDKTMLHLNVTAFSQREIVDLVRHVNQRTCTDATYNAPRHGWTCFHCGMTFMTEFGARLHFGMDPGEVPVCKREIKWVRQKPAVPQLEGWYRVMHPGDSDSVDGHTIYDYPDYEDWAYWTPAKPEELEEEGDGYKGSWTTMHDEEGDMIFAYAGPVVMPKPFEKSTVQMPVPEPKGDLNDE